MSEQVPFCKSCGDAGGVAHLLHQIETLEEQLDQAWIEVRKKTSENSRLTGERNRQIELDPHYGDGLEVWKYWKEILSPNAREFSPERARHVIARLKAGWSVEMLKKCVDGAKARPYKGRPSTDFVTIFKSETQVMMFLRFAGVRIDQADPAEQADPVIDDTGYKAARARLMNHRGIVRRLLELQGWSAQAIVELGLGFDGERIVFPIRNPAGGLIGLANYAPNPKTRTGPKMIAEGVRDLFPAPEGIRADSIWLVEGEPDAVAMWTMRQPCVAVPGVNKWKPEWAQRFDKFERVRICFDCDEEGREAAAKRQADLKDLTEVSLIDLDPDRDDKYDVGDLLLEYGPEAAVTQLAKRSSPVYAKTMTSIETKREKRDPFAPPPFVQVREALEHLGMTVKEQHDGHIESQCPNHDDRNPSLSVSEGDDQRVLLHCHTGCETEEIVHALGLEMRDLFAA